MPAADPYPVLCLLRSHLESLAANGQRRLWLTGEARQALKEIVRLKPRPWPADRVTAPAAMDESPVPVPVPEQNVVTPPAVAVSVPAVAPAPPEREQETIPEPMAEPASFLNSAMNTDSTPGLSFDSDSDDSIPGPDSTAASPQSELTLEEKETALAKVRERAEEGQAARALGTLRDRMVFAVGTPAAEIVLVGEAPGSEEEKQREPFVGPAGQLLTRILKVMGLERSQVYITNICKYRPAMESQGSRNRQPTVKEMASCLDFVREEIRIIRPKVIVALGATASAGLLGIKTGVMSARGKFYDFEGIPAMVTLHPSYLLRCEQGGPEAANAEKRKVWEDMMQVMERAGMPVSEKQRRFFLPK
ncbi:MAG: uracil-dna glycosylase-like [Verrucomicrobiales bacterium]|nr:uracil-dna glycosylase-like [Verrucomicrobiales bacterium]